MMRNILLLLIILITLPAAAVATERPFASLLNGAEDGNRAAMLETGLSYYNGTGVERDCYEARRWLKKSAEFGEVEAFFTLGVMDDEGSCGIAQAEAAFENFRKAALKGHSGASYRLGELYRTGRAEEVDYKMAFRWMKEASRKGESLAWCGLARLYAKGNGIPQDKTEARHWIKKGLSSGKAETIDLCQEVQAELGLNERP